MKKQPARVGEADLVGTPKTDYFALVDVNSVCHSDKSDSRVAVFSLCI